jgi:periplasmic protein TonB
MSAARIRPLAAFLASLAVHACLLWRLPSPPVRPLRPPLQARLVVPPLPVEPEIPPPQETPPTAAPAREKPHAQPPAEPAAVHDRRPPAIALPARIGDIPVLQGTAARQALQQLGRQLLYPPLAIAQNQQGQALVLVILDDAGNAIAGRVEESSGFPLLDEAAVRAVRTLHGLPTDTPREFVLPVHFRLE